MLEHQDLFISGEGGYKLYRIPAIVTTQSGRILAFCEGRRFTGGDEDEIDIVMRASEDGGKSFGPLKVVASRKGYTVGNPAPIADRNSDTVWMLVCQNIQNRGETLICEGKAPRTVWVTCSKDGGETWEPMREITDQVKKPEWTWYATGPGHGVQLQSGRLLVACDHVVGVDKKRDTDPHRSHLIYSDDNGLSWEIGAIAPDGTNESTAVETVDGWVNFNCRNHPVPEDQRPQHRAVAWSSDGGENCSPFVHDAGLPEPICQGSLCRYSTEEDSDRNRVLFSNPSCPTQCKRQRMTVRMSYDECQSWAVENVLCEGPAAYSDLCVTPQKTICCLYEAGMDWPYDRIRLAHFDLEWLSSS